MCVIQQPISSSVYQLQSYLEALLSVPNTSLNLWPLGAAALSLQLPTSRWHLGKLLFKVERACTNPLLKGQDGFPPGCLNGLNALPFQLLLFDQAFQTGLLFHSGSSILHTQFYTRLAIAQSGKVPKKIEVYSQICACSWKRNNCHIVDAGRGRKAQGKTCVRVLPLAKSTEPNNTGWFSLDRSPKHCFELRTLFLCLRGPLWCILGNTQSAAATGRVSDVGTGASHGFIKISEIKQLLSP